jgi:glycosyltransferase involved in cell wall biosynthesis
MACEPRLSLNPHLTILVPVYEEGENIEKVVRVLECLVRIPHELLVVYDHDEDGTLPVLRELSREFPNIRMVKNRHGRGVVNAVKTGFSQSDSEMVCLFTGDFTDQPEAIVAMAKQMAEGYDLVSGARYIKGGRKYGGPWLQTKLSRWGNWLFRMLTGFPLTDITYSFKVYRRRLLDAVHISGEGGWVMSMEITVQAYLKGFKMAEIPTVWVDRQLGESRFRLWKWLPVYTRWFFYGVYEINRRRLAKAFGRSAVRSESA